MTCLSRRAPFKVPKRGRNDVGAYGRNSTSARGHLDTTLFSGNYVVQPGDRAPEFVSAEAPLLEYALLGSAGGLYGLAEMLSLIPRFDIRGLGDCRRHVTTVPGRFH